jgi:hypothetical protein
VYHSYGAGRFLWDISYARWGVEYFYLNEVTPKLYMTNMRSYIQQLGFEPSNKSKDLGVIFAIGVAWRLVAFVVMKLTHRDKKA